MRDGLNKNKDKADSNKDGIITCYINNEKEKVKDKAKDASKFGGKRRVSMMNERMGI